VTSAERFVMTPSPPHGVYAFGFRGLTVFLVAFGRLNVALLPDPGGRREPFLITGMFTPVFVFGVPCAAKRRGGARRRQAQQSKPPVSRRSRWAWDRLVVLQQFLVQATCRRVHGVCGDEHVREGHCYRMVGGDAAHASAEAC
jgi:hypothetical protein